MSDALTFYCEICGESFEDRLDHLDSSVVHLRAENERMREALKPFAHARDIAVKNLGVADVGHLEAVAGLYIKLSHMNEAKLAMKRH